MYCTSRWVLSFLWFFAVSSLCVAQQNSSLRVTVMSDQGISIPLAQVHIAGLDRVGLPAPDGTVLFKEIPPGAYSVIATFPGFKDKVVFGVILADGKTKDLTILMESAPPKAADYKASEGLASRNFYSKALTGINQPLLCPDSVSEGKEWYRFLWVPTFSPPVFLRVDIEPDGTAQLLTYEWPGQGGYDWGKPKKSERKLTSEQQAELYLTLADFGFWTLPTRVDPPPNVVVLDGTEWFLEGVKEGNCHVVTRYSTPLNSLVARQFLGIVATVKPYNDSDR
jgi:Carboxypeptidase regulatory-like domain